MALTLHTDDGWTPKIGLIVLSTDETLEPELRSAFAPTRAGLYHTRIPSAPHVTPETLAAMRDGLAPAARLLPPGTTTVGYACTSGATVIGRETVQARVGAAQPGANVTDPITAAIAAFRQLGVARIGLITPYVPSVTDAMRRLFEAEGIAVGSVASFEQSEEAIIARITEAAVLKAVTLAGNGEAEAVFASCTNLRTFGMIDAAEAAIGKPVISSNAALAWHLGRLAGLEGLAGPGALFAR